MRSSFGAAVSTQRLYFTTRHASSPMVCRSAAALSCSSQLTSMHRFQARFNSTDAKQQQAASGEAKPADGKAEGEAKPGEEKPAAEEEKKPEGMLASLGKLRQDFKTYPEIYNSVNMTHLVLFTIFCLCSTGTERETAWWMDQWGIDKDFRPFAWVLHALLSNNIMTLSFAMILWHYLGHATLAQLGARNFVLYCGITCILSGFLMWATAYYRDYSVEKQYGPWDVIAALSVMQYLAVGTTPWGLLFSYSGWLKFANGVGAVCILYYDPQPVFWGTLIGLFLCKSRIIAPVAPKV